MTTLKNYLQNLNLFPSSDNGDDREDEQLFRTNLIVTRIYLFVLTLSLILLALYVGLNKQTTTFTIHYPTSKQFESLPVDAYCPCTHMSISYGQFTSFETIFHQVCSSDFITDRWIEALYTGSNATYFFLTDFRTQGSTQFLSLATLCRLVRLTADKSVTRFQMDSISSPAAISSNVLRSKVEASINEFQQTTVYQFRTQLNLIHRMLISNQVLSFLQTNKILWYVFDGNQTLQLQTVDMIYSLDGISYCSCFMSVDCVADSIITNLFHESTQIEMPSHMSLLFEIPGFFSGCLPLDGLLFSTLECFYNQQCVDELLTFFPTTESFVAMAQLPESRFRSDFKLQRIVDDMMIEKWITNISFDNYYHECAPISCTYSTNDRQSFLSVITTLVESLGGLTVILGSIIPFVIRFIRRPRNDESVPLKLKLRRIKEMVKELIVEMNIFKHQNSDEQQIHYQRLGTRMYILILIIFSVIVAFLSLLIEEIHRDTIVNPTEAQYNKLQKLYPSDRLSCPCTTIFMNYSSFLDVYAEYHQLCSSDMISDAWIQYNSFQDPTKYHHTFDYRARISSYFQLLKTLCENARQTVTDAIRLVLETQFVASQVIPQELFEFQVNSTVRDWKINTIDRYLRTIQLVRGMTFGNQLSSNSFAIQIINENNQFEIFVAPLARFGDCVCGLSSLCRVNLGIYTLTMIAGTNEEIFSMPNLFFGCSPIDGLLQSTLEIFYNQTFLITLDQYMYRSLGNRYNFSALNPNRNSPNEVFERIVNRLMVDFWSVNISYHEFFRHCAPAVCHFEYKGRNDILIVIMKIIGIFGGLSLGIKVSILILLRFFEKMHRDWSLRGLHRFLRSLCTCQTELQLINRLHVILLLILLVIIYSFSTLTSQTRTFQVIQPTITLYKSLLQNFSNSLKCSCSQLSIEYSSFLSIQPYFHPLCNSSFVSEEWLWYLYGDGYFYRRYPRTDIRNSAIGQFELIAFFCQLSQAIINDFILQLMATDFIDTQLLSFDVFNDRIRFAIDAYLYTTMSEFLDSFNLIRDVIGGNMIMSFLSTNWQFIYDTIIHNEWTIHTKSAMYNECDCGLSWQCSQPSRGMMVGCYPIEALLQTTLTCFYDQNCIDPDRQFASLNISNSDSNRFNISSTFESLLNHLMIDRYSFNLSYENYFKKCAPSSCSYINDHYISATAAFTSLISLYGGLVIITRCLAVIISKCRPSRPNHVTPVITIRLSEQ